MAAGARQGAAGERTKGADRQQVRKILEQYTSLQEEQKDIRERILKLEGDIRELEETSPETADSVTCGRKGRKALRTVKVSGFPEQEYQTKRGRLEKLKMKLELVDDQLLELLTEAEEYIEKVEDSRMRRILRYKYMDNMTWRNIAKIMGGKSTADSIRMEHNRFLEKK